MLREEDYFDNQTTLPNPQLDIVAAKIEAEITATICKGNPSIGRMQFVTLKKGPIAFKSLSIYQILHHETKEHHHTVLCLQTHSYDKKTSVISKQDKYSFTIDDKSGEEIRVLENSIKAFLDEITIEPDIYAIVRKQLFEQLLNKDPASTSEAINSILEDQTTYDALIKQGGVYMLKGLIDWVIQSESSTVILDKLKELNLNTINELNVVSGLAQLLKALELWNQNKGNSDEEFWQKSLNQFPWIISQVFSYPFVLFSGKAYVGGKEINNKGGNVVDFLYKNTVTNNIVLIEIKTPSSRLLSSSYRQSYSISNELSGGMNQLLNYRKQIQHEYYTLNGQANAKNKFLAINPKTILVIGNAAKELTEESMVDAFELFRGNSNGIEIVTFDELFKKIELLIDIFRAGVDR